jgi:glycosyltransferase involved in cell wall biosynthesis
MVARFNYVKDHFTLVKAFSKLIEEEHYSDVKLILIGEPANKDIEFMILNSKSRDSIRLMGSINNVCETIKFFDVGALSSLHEGFPNVIGEYILSNLIVVATDVGEVKNILNQKSPLLSSPRDCDSLKENFKVALSMTEYTKNDIITKNKDKIINNFTIENISDQYIDCYND